MFNEVFDAFIDESPISVMYRGTLENIFAARKLDDIFSENAVSQVNGKLAFSTCAGLLSLVTTRIQPSVNAAYGKKVKEIAVSVNAVYDKLKGIELSVSQALVSRTAAELSELVRQMGALQEGPLPGYDTRIVDGNYIAATDRRIKELRGGPAPLPGHTVAVLNPAVEMIEHLICCEDGHASQKPLYVGLLEHVQRGQCWIADRDYSTMDFLFGLRDCGAFFIIRQHGNVKGQLRERRRRVGETETGIVYEQPICLTHSDGREFDMRRITVHLYEATRDGDTEVHLLSNLPAEIDACTIADTFRSRWSIETAFAKLTTDLRCELNTLGFPKAALFSFCVAVVMYNALSAVVAALRVAHPEVPTGNQRKSGADRTFSIYYIADEISGVSRGMSIAIGEEYWASEFATLTIKQLGRRLIWLATRVKIRQYLTHPYGAKGPKAKSRRSGKKHVSTFRELEKRKKLRESG